MVDPDLIAAMAYQESGGNANARSNKGAIGVMQLMPATVEKLGLTDPWDEAQNLKGGIDWMQMELDHWGGDVDRAIAAYNTGDGNVQAAIDAARKRGLDPSDIENIKPFLSPETRNYHTRISSIYNDQKARRREQAVANDPVLNPEAPDAPVSSVDDFTSEVQALVTKPGAEKMSPLDTIRQISDLYGSKRWDQKTEPVLKSLMTDLWNAVPEEQRPDFREVAREHLSLIKGDDPKELAAQGQSVKEKIKLQMRNAGQSPALYGDLLDKTVDAHVQEQTERAGVRNRSFIGELGLTALQAGRGFAEGITNIAAFVPDMAGYEETGKAIREFPKELFGETREMEFMVDANGGIALDEQGQPIRRNMGQYARMVGSALSLFAGGKGMELAVGGGRAAVAAMGGMNALATGDSAYAETRAEGGTHEQAVHAALWTLPASTLAGALDATVFLQPGATWTKFLTKKSNLVAAAAWAARGFGTGAVGGAVTDVGLQAGVNQALGREGIDASRVVGAAAISGTIGAGFGVGEGYLGAVQAKEAAATIEALRAEQAKRAAEAAALEPKGPLGLPAPEPRLGLPAPAIRMGRPTIQLGDGTPAPRGAVEPPVTEAQLPDPEIARALPKKLESFQDGKDTVMKIEVGKGKELPPGIRSVFSGFDFQKTADGEFTVLKRTEYVRPSIDEKDIHVVEERIRSLTEEIDSSPRPEEQQDLIAHRRELLQEYQELTGRMFEKNAPLEAVEGTQRAATEQRAQLQGQIEEQQRIVASDAPPAARMEAYNKLQDLRIELGALTPSKADFNPSQELKRRHSELASQRAEIEQKIAKKTRNSKNLKDPVMRRQVQREIEDLNQQLTAIDEGALSSKGGLRAVDIRREIADINRRLEIISPEKNPTYLNDLQAKDAELSDLLSKRAALKEQNDTYVNTIKARDVAVQVETDSGPHYVLAHDSKWYVLDSLGRIKSAGHDYAGDAIDAARTVGRRPVNAEAYLATINKILNPEPAAAEAPEVAATAAPEASKATPPSGKIPKSWTMHFDDGRPAALVDSRGRPKYVIDSEGNYTKATSADLYRGIRHKDGSISYVDGDGKAIESTQGRLRVDRQGSVVTESPRARAMRLKTEGIEAMSTESEVARGATDDARRQRPHGPVNPFTGKPSLPKSEFEDRPQGRKRTEWEGRTFGRAQDYTEEVPLERTSTKKVSAKDIYDRIKKGVVALGSGTDFSVGGIMGKGVRAYLQSNKNYMKAQRLDIEAMVHEWTHAIDMHTFGLVGKDPSSLAKLPPEVVNGLIDTALTYYPALEPLQKFHENGDPWTEATNWTYAKEGWATTIQRLATGQSIHRDVKRWLDTTFAKEYPRQYADIQEVTSMYHDYLSQNARTAVQSAIAEKPSWVSRQMKKLSLDNFLLHWEDSKGATRGYDKATKGATNLRDRTDRLRNVAEPLAQHSIDVELVDPLGNKVFGDAGPLSTSIRAADKAGRGEDLRLYMTAKHMDEAYIKQGMEPGGGPAMAKQIQDYVRQIEATDPEIVGWANDYWKRWDVLHQIIGDSSPALQRVFEKQRAANIEATGQSHGYYLPVKRESAAGFNFSRKRTGSKDRFEDPFQHVGKVLRGMYELAHQNYLRDYLLESSMNPDLATGAYVRDIGILGKRAAKGSKLAELSDAYNAKIQEAMGPATEEMGPKLKARSREDAEDMIGASGAILGVKAPEGFVYMTHRAARDSQIHVFEVAKNMEAVFSDKAPDFSNVPFFKALVGSKRLFQYLATAGRPAFMIPNFARDVTDLYLRSNESNPIKLAYYVAEGLMNATASRVGIKQLAGWHEWAAAQGLHASSRFGSEGLIRQKDYLASVKKNGYSLVDLTNATLGKMMSLVSVGEEGVRLAAAIAQARHMGLKRGDVPNPQEALEIALAYRRNTNDYSIQGVTARNINTWNPFFTARIANTAQTIRSIKEHPVKAATVALGWLSAGIAYALAHKDDGWYKEMQPEERGNFLHIPFEVDGQKKLLRWSMASLPMATWTMGQAIGSAMGEQGYAKPELQEFVSALIKGNLPVNVNFDSLEGVAATSLDFLGPLGKEIGQQLANKDFYFNKQIVPRGMEAQPAQEQYTNYTSELAKYVGDVTGLSPLRIEHAIKAQGPAALDAIRITEDLTGIKRPKGAEGDPLTKRAEERMINTMIRFGSPITMADRSTKKFYEILDKFQSNSTRETPEEERARKKLNKIQESLGAVNTVMWAMGDEDQEALQQLADTRRQLLESAMAIDAGEEDTAAPRGPVREAERIRKEQKKLKAAAREGKTDTVFSKPQS